MSKSKKGIPFCVEMDLDKLWVFCGYMADCWCCDVRL